MWTKKFRKRKLQSVMLLLMVLICSLLMTGSLIILTSLGKPYKELETETAAAALKVYPIGNVLETGKDWKKELSNLPSVKEVEEVIRHTVTENVYMNGKKTEIFISLVKNQPEFAKQVRLLEGQMDQLGEKDCYISSAIANSQNVGIGDKIEIKQGSETHNYTVKAIYADVFSLHTSFQVEMLVQQIPEGLLIEPYYKVFTKEGKTGEDVSSEYMDSHDGLLDGNFYTSTESISNAHVTENILGAILLVLSIVIFLVSLIMIRYMLRNALIHDTKTIAIYKSMGYTNRAIKGIYLTFYQAIVFAGALAGALCSPLISNVFMSAAFANLGVKSANTGLPQALLCMLVMNLFVFLQLHCELHRVDRLKPTQLLMGETAELGIKKQKTPGKHKNMENFSPFAMAVRMMKRDRKNTILILVTCILSVYMVNLAIVCFDNMEGMRKDNAYWLGFDNHDVSVSIKGDSDAFAQMLRQVERDSEVEQLARRNLDMGFGIPYENSVSAMVYETFEGVDMPLIAGRSPQNREEIVIGNIYAKKLDKQIGDYIDVYLSSDVKVSLLIVGTYQGFYGMGRGVRIRGDAFTQNNVPLDYPEASIYLKEGTDKAAFIKRMNNLYGADAEFIDRQDLYSNIISEIVDPQKAALGPFVVLAVLIGALNLIYIVYLKNLNSIKTYSIYKSLGYPASHLVRMNMCYVAILAVVSIVVALPLFKLVFPRMMVLAMSAFGFAQYRVHFNMVTLLLGNAGVLVIFLISVILSSRELYKNHFEQLVSE